MVKYQWGANNSVILPQSSNLGNWVQMSADKKRQFDYQFTQDAV